ncbi:uncharacterized protein LOC133354973 [Lethenteron reissneri]|uniref:uncharacterized protein LOC133354973 n=1 Tax=Lethenteron reissneri TaxID=7753 RepID=UPI002AB77726|nr:uncharacterized protein LOC133354973 [Lethenteron reissneri]
MSAERYAARKRKKPSVFGPKFLIGEGIHNNASKRHRDRLNSEMEDLAAALPLPPAAIAKLDKLSVLRLSVGYLRARAFFQQLDTMGRSSPPPPDQTLTNAIDSGSGSSSTSSSSSSSTSSSSSSSPSAQQLEFVPFPPREQLLPEEQLPSDECHLWHHKEPWNSPLAVVVPADCPAASSPPLFAPRRPSPTSSSPADEADAAPGSVAEAGLATVEEEEASPASPPPPSPLARHREEEEEQEEEGRAVVPCEGGGRLVLPPFPGLIDPEMLLESMSGVLLVIMADGMVFYVSQNIQQYLGFNQTDVILESVFDLIHADDRAVFQARLCWEETERCDSGEQSTAVSEQQRNFSCRFRCLLDNNSGFMMIQVQGKLKRLGGGGVGSMGAGGGGPALFALAVPQNPMLPTELRLWNIIFTTKHKLDFSTLSLDSKARLVLGYTNVEFRRRKAVNFQHLGDMLYLKANNLILMRNGESEPVVFRLLSKQGKWLWVKASARIIYRKGKADFIIATQFLLRDEEGEYYLKNRNPECKFDVTGEAIAVSQIPPITSQQPKAKLCRSSSSDNRSISGGSKAGQELTKRLTSKAKITDRPKNGTCVTAEPALTLRDTKTSLYTGKMAQEKRDIYHRAGTYPSSLSSSSSPDSAESFPSEWEERLTDPSTLPDDALARGSPPGRGLSQGVPGSALRDGACGQLGLVEHARKEERDCGFLSLLNRHDMTGLDVVEMLGMDAMEALDEGDITGSDRVSIDEVLEGVLRDMDGAVGRSDEEALLHPSLAEGLPPSVWMFLQSMDQASVTRCEQTVPQLSPEGPASESPSDEQLDVISDTDVDPSLELPEDLGPLKSTARALNTCPVRGIIKECN